MYGFTIIYNNISQFSVENAQSISFIEETSKNKYSFFYEQSKKFKNDKLFTETNDFVIGIDGVILNLADLKKSTNITDYTELVLHLFKNDKQFYAQFKGDFSGFIFNKKTEELISFTNHVASQKVFYSQVEQSTIISHKLEHIAQFRKVNSLNIDSAYALLTYGGMLENNTIIKDVCKLRAGEYIDVKPNSFEVNQYFDFNSVKVSITDAKEATKKLDKLFNDLIELEYQKDIEYGYDHIATLSGGLDSRMNVMAANKLGYKTHNFCFSQSNYDDHKIAEEISNDLDNKFSFIALDNADYLTEVDENMSIYDGQIFYLASAHYNYTLNNLETDNYGLIHTGQIGDGVLGGFVSPNQPDYSTILLSKKLTAHLPDAAIENYSSEETFKLANRVFNVTVAGSYVSAHHQSYLVSPFLDPEFISLCLSLHPSLKKDSKIYFDWINEFRPEVANYKWEKTGFKPDAVWKKTLSQYTKKIKNTYYSKTNQLNKTSMNPYDYWYNNNPEIVKFFDSNYNKYIGLITDKALSKNARFLFEEGNTIEKSLVLTLTHAINKFNLKA